MDHVKLVRKHWSGSADRKYRVGRNHLQLGCDGRQTRLGQQQVTVKDDQSKKRSFRG